jgi:hypothetical protein
MAGLLQPGVPEEGKTIQDTSPEAGQERRFSRSPHPYHRRGTSLLDTEVESDKQGQANNRNKRYSTTNSSSESGTEADDERGRLLRSLPAPPLRPHKGLRDAPFKDPTPQPSPVGTPPAVENNEKQLRSQGKGSQNTWGVQEGFEIQFVREKYTKRKRSELVRRITETVLFSAVGLVVSHSSFSEGRLQECKSGEADYIWTRSQN